MFVATPKLVPAERPLSSFSLSRRETIPKKRKKGKSLHVALPNIDANLVSSDVGKFERVALPF